MEEDRDCRANVADGHQKMTGTDISKVLLKKQQEKPVSLDTIKNKIMELLLCKWGYVHKHGRIYIALMHKLDFQ